MRRASSSTPSEFSAAVDVRLLRRVGVPRLPCTSSRSSISLLSAVRRAQYDGHGRRRRPRGVSGAIQRTKSETYAAHNLESRFACRTLQRATITIRPPLRARPPCRLKLRLI